ncbi:unnamed protein product [Diamesa hyperborea]
MWFDSSSIANLAKNAFKEAQKQIDKALDIKDDEDLTSSVISDDTKMTKSKTLPAIATGNLENNDQGDWGSFDNGSFFESKKTVSNPITNPPPTRKSETSSESLEILSTPSSMLSPDQKSSQSTLQGSEDSVEIVSNTPTSEMLSPDFQQNTPSILSPDSVELTEDSSNSDVAFEESSNVPITIAPGRTAGLHLTINKSPATSLQESEISAAMLSASDNTLTLSETDSFYEATKDDLEPIIKLDANLSASFMDKSMESFEIQTQISDSTHSFEEINHPSKSKVAQEHTESKDDEKKTSNSGSGHTSGDEIETTSSDIEIINSPNGDSSSTNSVNKISPVKSDNFPYKNSESYLGDLKLNPNRGHSREHSEVSVLSLASDDSRLSPSEIDKLVKRINELSEILEQREYKMMQLGRNNAELHETNLRLTTDLEGLKKKRNSLDISNVQEEYTQRLSALEKKFQISIRENSVLKKQTETLKSEVDSKVSKEDYEKMVTEKDFVIDALRLEGEKLSKQVLQHSNIIKKLRAKLKEDEEKLKKQEAQNTEFTDENKSLKKTLATKDEIEKSQTEGINKLTADKRRIDKENHQLKSQNEDLVQKNQALQLSYDAAKKEVSDKSSEMVRNLEDEKERTVCDNKQMQRELQDLRQKIRDSEAAANEATQKLRQENLELKRKIEETEFRIEDQKQEASLASIPLIRQLESLQTTLNSRTKTWENQEKILIDQLDEAQNKLKSQTEVDKSARDQVQHFNLKVANLEEKLSFTSLKLEQTAGQLQQKEIEFGFHESDFNKRIDQLNGEMSIKVKDLEKFKILLAEAEDKLRMERDGFEDEKRKLSFIQQSSQHHHHHSGIEGDQTLPGEHELGNCSPALSLGRISDESLHQWNDDMNFHDVGANSTYGSQYGGVVMQSSASLMEGLQSVLKQRDGEVQQLQWELQRLQTERNFLSNEMSSLTVELEKATDKIKENNEDQVKQNEMQVQYDALLEMYGQKSEEFDELKLDLVDLKSISQMYKTQIDELTQKINN